MDDERGGRAAVAGCRNFSDERIVVGDGAGGVKEKKTTEAQRPTQAGKLRDAEAHPASSAQADYAVTIRLRQATP